MDLLLVLLFDSFGALVGIFHGGGGSCNPMCFVGIFIGVCVYMRVRVYMYVYECICVYVSGIEPQSKPYLVGRVIETGFPLFYWYMRTTLKPHVQSSWSWPNDAFVLYQKPKARSLRAL